MLFAAYLVIRPEVERQRAERPGEFVCGNPFIPVLLVSGLAGFGSGLWAGWRVCRRFLP
jgi:hypothetical protein